MMDHITFIVGPTAVGKTEFGIELAKKVSGEIISADSMQVYRGMDIMSQKPALQQRREVPHHLIDIIDVDEEYSAAEFVKRAVSAIDEIIEMRKVPIVIGGSGLYIKALIDGLFPTPKKDAEFRRALEAEALEGGSDALYGRLKEVDLQAASKIHKNDLRRIIRALEIFHLTARPASKHKPDTKGIKERFNITIYGLIRPKAALNKRAEERVERMFDKGLVREVTTLRKKSPGITASASLGYKEICGYLDKRYTLEEAKELLKKNTRHFIKKQRTWFNADKRIRWIDLEDAPLDEAVEMMADYHTVGDGWKKG